MSRRPTIVRGGYIRNQSAHSHRSYQPVRGLVTYLTFGNVTERLLGTNEPRGVWVDQVGRSLSHTEVHTWAKEKVHRFRYDHAYQLLLSTGKGGLDSADFNTALRAGSHVSDVHEWRMMTHHDTSHLHAHVILFRHEPLSKKQYLDWQQTMQLALDKRQLARSLEREQTFAQHIARDSEMSRDQSNRLAHKHRWGIES